MTSYIIFVLILNAFSIFTHKKTNLLFTERLRTEYETKSRTLQTSLVFCLFVALFCLHSIFLTVCGRFSPLQVHFVSIFGHFLCLCLNMHNFWVFQLLFCVKVKRLNAPAVFFS